MSLPIGDDTNTAVLEENLSAILMCLQFPSNNKKFSPPASWVELKSIPVYYRENLSKMHPKLDPLLEEGKTVLSHKTLYISRMRYEAH